MPPDAVAPALTIGRGARATEALLFREVFRLCDEAEPDPALLARPVRVIVPSRSLRDHVAAQLVGRRGRALAGVEVQTLLAFARDVAKTAGEAALGGDAAFPVLVRRLARAEAPLRESLEGLDDGYGAVVGAVADLLDAGFGPAQREGADDALAETLGSSPRAARARAVVRVAAAVATALEDVRCARRGSLLARARALLEAAPERAGARAILAHGFADATGLATDLLATLVRRCAARVFLDAPPDPGPDADGRDDVGFAFVDRLRQTLESAGGSAVRDPEPAPGAAIAALRAPGAFPEARAAAESIRSLLDAGDLPAERIGIVVRELTPYAVPLRLHLRRLGVPFSGAAGVAPPGRTQRRLQALLGVLADGEASALDRWIDALGRPERGARADLRLALHAVGAARLRDVAALDPAPHLDTEGRMPLPVRVGFVTPPDESDGAGEPRRALKRRRLEGDVLRAAVAGAQALCARIDGWPESAAFEAHRAALDAVLRDDLGWSAEWEEAQLLADRLDSLAADLAGIPLSREDLVLVVRRALADAGSRPVGGRGGGVALLGVVEARARTFEHLFVLGMNRDVFPRPAVDDPLLPEEARLALQPILPEIPLKSRVSDEERYLFAQLLSAAPHVTLSWQSADDDGKARSPSPLVESLRLQEKSIGEAPGLHAPPGPREPRYRTAAEALLAEGLHGGRARTRFARLLPAALAESGAARGAAAERLAHSRMAVLKELDPTLERAHLLGPYFGFVGSGEGWVRGGHLYVTHLERIADCPWRFLLERLLGLEPPPDALDRLPTWSNLLVGNVVHRVLERIAQEAGCKRISLEDARRGEAHALPWPDAERLDAWLDEAARSVLAEEGIGPPQLGALLVEAAQPRLARARELDWPGPGSGAGCTGVEVEGDCTLAAGVRVGFRADRVDRMDAGGLRLIDYKAGKAVTGSDLRKTLLARMAKGKLLQVPAYAFGADAEGRYLYLAPDGGVVALDPGDAEARALFEAVSGALHAIHTTGAFFPRLCGHKDTAPTDTCRKWCEMREACLQGDAGSRRRLFEWAQRAEADGDAERALLGIWDLAGRKP